MEIAALSRSSQGHNPASVSKTHRKPKEVASPGNWELECLSPFDLENILQDLEVLSRHCLTPNIFFQSKVVQAAWPRLSSLLAPKGCWMLCLWQETSKGRKLKLFMPVGRYRQAFSRITTLRPLCNEYMPIGTPLMDADNPGLTAQTFIKCLSEFGKELPGILDLTYQLADSPVFEHLRAAAAQQELHHRITRQNQRAALIKSRRQNQQNTNLIGKKSLRELKRQWRQLEDRGEITITSAKSTDEILNAFEHFLSLELRSWKGRQGTALYNHKNIAVFSRQIIAELAADGRCEIFLLQFNPSDPMTSPTPMETIIGAAIFLGKGRQVVPWKMAFDESFARYSPGMQIMYHATQSLLRREDFIQADSLAVPDHWMMNRLWADRVEIADLTIALSPQANHLVNRIITAKRMEEAFKTLGRKMFRAMGWRR